MFIGQHQATLFQGPQGHRDTAAGDVQVSRDVRDPRPTAVMLAHFMDRQQVMSPAVRQFVRFKFFPGFHVTQPRS